MKNIVVMASGSGSNFQSIIDAVQSGKIKNARISGLIAGKPGIGAIKRAQNAVIPVFILPDLDSEDRAAEHLNKSLNKWKPDLIVLAGFLRKIPAQIVREYHDKIINIHPSLLPKFGGKGFYGILVHQSVLKAGETESGCTVHFVNEQYDEGNIIRQTRVPVLPDDTAEDLAARILTEEHKLLPAVINELLNPNSK